MSLVGSGDGVSMGAREMPSCHFSDQSDPQADELLKFLKCLVKHCRDTNTPWSVEASSRSCLWGHCKHVALGERVQIKLCMFGHPCRSPVTIATSRPKTFKSLAVA